MWSASSNRCFCFSVLIALGCLIAPLWEVLLLNWGVRVFTPQSERAALAYVLGCMLSSLFCELTALWACEKVTPAVAVLLLTISLLTLCLAAPVNDVNIHFDSDEMQALRGGMQKRLAVYAAVSGTVFLCARRYLVSFPHPLVSLPCACFWHGWGLESP